MKSIEILMGEHQEILKFTDALEKEAVEILNGSDVREDFYRAAIEFIRKVADGSHHKKEEGILFEVMIENLGPVAKKLIESGMLVEHQQARGYCMKLEENLNSYLEKKDDISKLQILTYSMSYVNLLRDHIDREDNVLYPFAEKNLSEDSKKIVDERSLKYDANEIISQKEKSELLDILKL